MSKLVHHLEYPRDVDRMMVPLLDAMNSIPGCRTLFSCDGHGREQFYVALSLCSRAAEASLKKWAAENVPESEVVDDDSKLPYSLPGTLDYEWNMGIYSWDVGTMKYRARRRKIAELASGLLQFIPDNKW